MNNLVLKGKSLKGKNRIREWGSNWLEVDSTPLAGTRFRVSHINEPDNMLVVAKGDAETISLRWIKLKDDPDFEIIERTPDEPPR